MCALQREGASGDFWDRRKSLDELLTTITDDEQIKGLLLNVKHRPRLLGGILPIGRHWLALRRESSARFVILDSNLAAPEELADQAELRARLHSAVQHDDAHIVLVRADR